MPKHFKHQMFIRQYGEQKGTELYIEDLERQAKSLADKLDKISTDVMPILNPEQLAMVVSILNPYA